MATGSPFGPDFNAMEADPEIRVRIREIRIFWKSFFRFFRFYGPLGTSGSPPDVPVPPNPDPDREIRFLENLDFSFFYFLSLNTLQYGCLWTRLDPTRSPVPR